MMKLHFITIFLILYIINCGNSDHPKRKIKLARQSERISNTNYSDPTTTLKLDAEDKQRLAILAFENRTNDKNLEWLCLGISDMIIRDVSQSPSIKVVPRQRIFDIFKKMGIKSWKNIDEKNVSRIARQASADAIIKGNFDLIKDSLEIQMQLFDGLSGILLNETKVRGKGLEQIFSLVDNLSLTIRSDFRISIQENFEHDMRISDISTNSLEAYKYYTNGVELTFKAYYGDALIEFEKAIKIDSTFAMAHFWRGVIYKKMENNTAAIKSIDKAVKFSHNAFPKERMKIQWIDAAFHGDHEKAFELLTKLVQAFPDDKELRYHLAVNYYVRREQTDSENQLEYALNLDPEYVQALLLKSVLLREKGDYKNAIIYLKECASISPEDADPYHNLGELYEAMGEYQTAIKYYKKAISLKPDFHFSVINLAHLYSTLGNYDDAKNMYEMSLAILPSEELKARAYTGLSQIDLSLGKYNSAKKQIRQALAFPSSETGKANYLIMLANLHFIKTDYDSSLMIVNEVLKTDNHFLPALNMKAKVFLKMDETDSAKVIAHVIDNFINQTKLEIYRNIHYKLLGQIAEAENDFATAIQFYQRIIQENAEAASVYLDLGLLCLKKNEPIKAVDYFKKYMRKKPTDAMVRYYLGCAYHAANKQDLALKIMNKFVASWAAADQDIPELIQAKKYLREWE